MVPDASDPVTGLHLWMRMFVCMLLAYVCGDMTS